MTAKIVQFKIFKNIPNLIHGISTRQWGNMALKVNGQLVNNSHVVMSNRRRLAQYLKIDPADIYEVNQVHGTETVVLDKAKINNYQPADADGLITALPGVFLLIKTADCLPLLFYDPVKQVVAAVHAGWRGTIGKIFLSAILKLVAHFGCQTKDLLVGIGPSLACCCFADKNLLQLELPEWQPFIQQKNGQFYLDQPAFVIDQLVKAGINPDKVELVDQCTYCSPDWFSHRRDSTGDNNKNGRFASIIGINHGA